MKNGTTATAVAALLWVASVACAQTATLNYDWGGADSSAISVGEIYTVNVSLDFEGGQDNLLAIDMSIALSGGLVGGIDNIVVDADYLAQGGSVTWDGSMLDVNTLGPTNLFVPAQGGAQALFSFQIDTTWTGGPKHVVADYSDVLIQTYNAQFQLASHTLTNEQGQLLANWVPSPGVLGVAGLWMVVGARRRRGYAFAYLRRSP